MKKMIFAVVMLFVVSCGSDNQTSTQNPNFNPNNNCAPSNISCQQNGPASDWVINTNFKNFPSKVRIILAGQTVVDECASPRGGRNGGLFPGRIQRSRNTNHVRITIDNHFTPIPGLLPLEIVRLGKKCFWWSTYYYQGDVDFNLSDSRNNNRRQVSILLPQ